MIDLNKALSVVNLRGPSGRSGGASAEAIRRPRRGEMVKATEPFTPHHTCLRTRLSMRVVALSLCLLAVAHGLLPAGAAPRGSAQRPRDGRVDVSRFDQAYYEKFYTKTTTPVSTPTRVRGIARVVGALARFHELPVRSVLDLGCGLGYWRRAARGMGARLRVLGRRGERVPLPTVRLGARRGRVVRRAGRGARPRRLRGRARVPRRPRVRARDRQHRPAPRRMAYIEATTNDDWRKRAVPSLSDRALRPRPADWYKRELGKHFIMVGAGLFVKKAFDEIDDSAGYRPTGPLVSRPVRSGNARLALCFYLACTVCYRRRADAGPTAARVRIRTSTAARAQRSPSAFCTFLSWRSFLRTSPICRSCHCKARFSARGGLWARSRRRRVPPICGACMVGCRCICRSSRVRFRAIVRVEERDETKALQKSGSAITFSRRN